MIYEVIYEVIFKVFTKSFEFKVMPRYSPEFEDDVEIKRKHGTAPDKSQHIVK